MQDLWTAIPYYGVLAVGLSLGLAIWAERLLENAVAHDRAGHEANVALHQSSATIGNDNSPMADISFRCPVTGMDIHWLEEPSAEGTSRESVECPICLRLHFTDGSTGELVNVEKSPPIVPVI